MLNVAKPEQRISLLDAIKQIIECSDKDIQDSKFCNSQTTGISVETANYGPMCVFFRHVGDNKPYEYMVASSYNSQGSKWPDARIALDGSVVEPKVAYITHDEVTRMFAKGDMHVANVYSVIKSALATLFKDHNINYVIDRSDQENLNISAMGRRFALTSENLEELLRIKQLQNDPQKTLSLLKKVKGQLKKLDSSAPSVSDDLSSFANIYLNVAKSLINSNPATSRKIFCLAMEIRKLIQA